MLAVRDATTQELRYPAAMKKSIALLATALVGCHGAPQRDVFVPPYADKGCWTKLYGKAGFGGPVRQLEGPAYVEALAPDFAAAADARNVPPQPLFNEVQSIEVGPHARLTGFTEVLFRGDTALNLAPGTRVDNVSALKFHERVQSFAMECKV